jgi:hypothetical protein
MTVVSETAGLLEDMMAKNSLFKDLVSNNSDFNSNYAAALGNLISQATDTADKLAVEQI